MGGDIRGRRLTNTLNKTTARLSVKPWLFVTSDPKSNTSYRFYQLKPKSSSLPQIERTKQTSNPESNRPNQTYFPIFLCPHADRALIATC